MNETPAGTLVPVPTTRERVAIHSQGSLTAPFDLKWLQIVRAIHETTQGHRLLHGAQESKTN